MKKAAVMYLPIWGFMIPNRNLLSINVFHYVSQGCLTDFSAKGIFIDTWVPFIG